MCIRDRPCCLSYIGITICIKPKTQASVNVTGKHGSVQLKTLTLILSMQVWRSVSNNAGWSGQNGWYGNTIVAHPLLKGATAAERFYGTAFPDLFGWLVKHMDEIPLPRKARQRVIRNPLKLQDVPA